MVVRFRKEWIWRCGTSPRLLKLKPGNKGLPRSLSPSPERLHEAPCCFSGIWDRTPGEWGSRPDWEEVWEAVNATFTVLWFKFAMHPSERMNQHATCRTQLSRALCIASEGEIKKTSLVPEFLIQALMENPTPTAAVLPGSSSAAPDFKSSSSGWISILSCTLCPGCKPPLLRVRFGVEFNLSLLLQ